MVDNENNKESSNLVNLELPEFVQLQGTCCFVFVICFCIFFFPTEVACRAYYVTAFLAAQCGNYLSRGYSTYFLGMVLRHILSHFSTRGAGSVLQALRTSQELWILFLWVLLGSYQPSEEQEPKVQHIFTLSTKSSTSCYFLGGSPELLLLWVEWGN